jgi:hypothetical protein
MVVSAQAEAHAQARCDECATVVDLAPYPTVELTATLPLAA